MAASWPAPSGALCCLLSARNLVVHCVYPRLFYTAFPSSQAIARQLHIRRSAQRMRCCRSDVRLNPAFSISAGAGVGVSQVVRGIWATPEAFIEPIRGKRWDSVKREWVYENLELEALELPSSDDDIMQEMEVGRCRPAGSRPPRSPLSLLPLARALASAPLPLLRPPAAFAAPRCTGLCHLSHRAPFSVAPCCGAGTRPGGPGDACSVPLAPLNHSLAWLTRQPCADAGFLSGAHRTGSSSCRHSLGPAGRPSLWKGCRQRPPPAPFSPTPPRLPAPMLPPSRNVPMLPPSRIGAHFSPPAPPFLLHFPSKSPLCPLYFLHIRLWAPHSTSAGLLGWRPPSHRSARALRRRPLTLPAPPAAEWEPGRPGGRRRQGHAGGERYDVLRHAGRAAGRHQQRDQEELLQPGARPPPSWTPLSGSPLRFPSTSFCDSPLCSPI